jgi:hypothetical protein
VRGRGIGCAGALIGFLTVAGAAAHPPSDHPLGPATLIVQRRAETRIVLRARFDRFEGTAPSSDVTVRVGSPGAERPLVEVVLPAAGWRVRGRRVRFRDPQGSAAGIRTLVLHTGRRGGRWLLKARGAAWDGLFEQTGGLDIVVRHDGGTWCASFVAGDDRIRRGRRLVLRTATGPSSCPCEPGPGDTWGALQRRVFARHACTQLVCHGNVPGSGGLTLAGGAAYAALVGVPSQADDTIARVEPGAPRLSMLWRKLAARTQGLDGVPGTPMPIGDPPLDEAELAGLAAWIAAGAPETGSVPAADVLLGFCVP